MKQIRVTVRRLDMRKELFTALVLFSAYDGARADGPESERKALAALEALKPIVKVDESKSGKPVLAIQFRPNFGKVTDDDLVQLKAFPSLTCVDLTNKKMITDAGLAHLAGLSQLEELNLNGTQVVCSAPAGAFRRGA